MNICIQKHYEKLSKFSELSFINKNAPNSFLHMFKCRHLDGKVLIAIILSKNAPNSFVHICSMCLHCEGKVLISSLKALVESCSVMLAMFTFARLYT